MTNKKIYSRILFWTIGLLASVSLWGQRVAEPSAKVLFEKVAALQKEGAVLSFYTETVDDRGSLLDKGNGTIWFKGNKFRMFYKNIDAVYDGTLMKTIDREQETLTISKPSPQDMLWAFNPMILQEPEQHFIFEPKGQKNGQWHYRAKPKGKHFRELDRVELYFDVKTGLPISSTARIKGGGTLHYKLSDIQKRKQLNNADFTFDKKQTQSLELIDLR